MMPRSGGLPRLQPALIACLLIVQQAHAATYYLDPVAGADSNPGTTQQTPWKSMSTVSSATQPGDQIYIQGWNETLSDSQWPADRVYFSRSVQKNSITWTFDQVKTIGQFVSRDFWVLGPAAIVSIDPPPQTYLQTYAGATRTVTIHGSMINPKNLIPAPDEAHHALDSRIYSWDDTLLARTPLTLQSSQSLMSVRSWKLEDAGCPAWNDGVKGPRPVIRYCGILTCVGTAPTRAGFRPAYCGDVKAYHYLDELDLSILPNLAPVTGTPTFQAFYDGVKRCWAPDIPCGWIGDYAHPSDHMPNYGRNLAAGMNNVAAALLLDTQSMVSRGYPADWKQQLAIPLIQFGIDCYGIVRNGGGWGWPGGGIGQGRKWPTLFAGLALDDAAMKNIGTDYGFNLQHRHFMDDAQVFYLSQADVDRFPKVVTRTNCRVDAADPRRVYDDSGRDWSIADDGTATPARAGEKLNDYWLLWDVGGANRLVRVISCQGTNFEVLHVRDPLPPGQGKTARVRLFPPERLGMPEWGERHMNNPQNDYYSRGYRIVATGNSMAGAHLAALALRTRDGQTSAKELWNWPAFFDYMDMYMHENFDAGWHRQWSQFAAQMWDAHRSQYGPVWPSTPPTTPVNAAPVLGVVGNQTVTAGQVVTFTLAATDADGDMLIFSATGLAAGATFTDRTFTWTPAAGQVGAHQVTFTTSDGQAQDSEVVTITVEPAPNSPPVLAGIGNKAAHENETLSFSLSATDADAANTLTYSAAGLPNGATFSGRDFRWTPGYSQAGTYQATFTVSDGQAQDSETITISVANLNRAPTMSGVSDTSVDAGNLLEFSISATDPDADSLSYSATGTPTGARFTGATFSWTPAADQAGSHTITFVASDGNLSDSRTVTITVVPRPMDATAPVVAQCAPEPDAVQVPLNNLVKLHITDAGVGVDPETVQIEVNGQLVYQGDQTLHTGASGRCSRSGAPSDYQYTYQADRMFDFDQAVTVRVRAADLQGNVMNEYVYSYVTEMRSFGANKLISKGGGSSDKARPVTVRDAAGNLWAAWHEGAEGRRDIYVAKLTAGADTFASRVQFTSDTRDQCYPDIAAGADGRVYLVWQDNRRGNWDIFASVCSDGQSFSGEVRVSDSDTNETAPAVVVDSQATSRVYVAWQDDRNGNPDVYVASSTNAFSSTTISQVTTNAASQTEPDSAVDGQNVAYIVWTDMRNGQSDIYGAASNAGPWTNVALVTTASAQVDPAVAAEPSGSILHLVWVDNAAGSKDIYYASSTGLPSSPLTGRSIIDDTSDAGQTAPTIVCTANKAFACWQDSRHVDGLAGDNDLYFAELTQEGTPTNILVGDDNSNADQSDPAIGVDNYGQPYMIWADSRNRTKEIYYAAATFIDPNPLDSGLVAASAAMTIGTDPAAIDQAGDVSIVLPTGACPVGARVTISRILHPPVDAIACLGSYDFGPSGIDFSLPVTVTIPYRYPSGNGRRAKPYWYDSLTGALSQQGITDIENVVVNSDLNALRFKTTHFTPFYLVASDSDSAASDDSGGNGGCSISTAGGGSPTELVIPYAVIALVMIVLRRRDRRRRELLQEIED